MTLGSNLFGAVNVLNVKVAKSDCAFSDDYRTPVSESMCLNDAQNICNQGVNAIPCQ